MDGIAFKLDHEESKKWKVGVFLLDLTWKLFCMTGNIDTYLLFKEMEGFNELDNEVQVEAETENGSTLH